MSLPVDPNAPTPPAPAPAPPAPSVLATGSDPLPVRASAPLSSAWETVARSLADALVQLQAMHNAMAMRNAARAALAAAYLAVPALAPGHPTAAPKVPPGNPVHPPPPKPLGER